MAGAAGAGTEGATVGSGGATETAAETDGEAGGAGVTDGTGSGRNAGVSPPPVSFGGSILAESDFPSPDGF